jgi:hypothetical protein
MVWGKALPTALSAFDRSILKPHCQAPRPRYFGSQAGQAVYSFSAENRLHKHPIGEDTIAQVEWASPDTDNGASHHLAFTRGTDSQGPYVQFTVPRLDYWDMVYFKTLLKRDRRPTQLSPNLRVKEQKALSTGIDPG